MQYYEEKQELVPTYTHSAGMLFGDCCNSNDNWYACADYR